MNNVQLRVGDLLYAAFKRWKMILALGLLGFICGFALSGVSYLQGNYTSYENSCTIAITSQSSTGAFTNNSSYLSTNDFHLAEDMVDAASFVMKSNRVLQAALDSTGLVSVSTKDVYQNLEVSRYNETQVLQLTLSWNNAAAGIRLMNASLDARRTILPEPLTSPMLTAEWEQKLTEIAKGGADPDTFMDGIRTMVQEIVSTYSCISEDGQKLFAPEKEVVGTCPRCGQPVYEGKKNFACSDRSCGFVLWKNDRFWTSRRKELTKKMAADLLKKGRTNVKGMWSEKKQAAYDAAVILCDTGGRYIDFKLEFPKNKRS